jgi:superfamily II DNA or RNA helicase
MRVRVPELIAINARVLQNPVRQLRRGDLTIEGAASAWSRRGVEGVVITDAERRTLLVGREIRPPEEMGEVLVVPDAVLLAARNGVADVDAREGRWSHPRKDILTEDLQEWAARQDHVRRSWRGQLSFKAERREAGEIVEKGLRPPQVGALHAILAHWTVTTEAATIVMPTGTGKTETMLAMLVATRPTRLLVVVPTDALREQIAAKFIALGVLRDAGVISPSVEYPVVGILKRRPRTPVEAAMVLERCNVVVTTMAVAGGCAEAVQTAMAASCSHLVIDEAHHVSAATWARFRRFFEQRPILQFTATPFRSDRKHVDGKVIYNYPLRKAQEEGLFKRINFRAVTEYDRDDADAAIARVACQQLSEDLANGFDHVVMARAGSIERAGEVLASYERHNAERSAAGFAPFGAVMVHSELPPAQRQSAIDKLRTREARIVVCVDMFGEGFDMPELKVAALHDMHKSLAITLQFTGRFTRTQANLGDATMVANVAGAHVEDSLRALYAEDADWNTVLRTLSEGATGRQAQRVEFLGRFEPPPALIPLQNVFPKMSTVAYRTTCGDWRPDAIAAAVGPDRLHGEVSINQQDRTAIFVTRVLEPVSWGEIREIANIIWDVYLVHWDKERELVFIHSSNNSSMHEWLAKAVAGDDVVAVRGEPMFRCFHGVQRLILMNLGLKHMLSRNVQFTMYVGSDILEALPQAQQVNKVKSNMFGRGYEEGNRTSYGCSYKGRVWSYRRAADIGEWTEWCHIVGAKLIDESITTDDALKFALVPTHVDAPPNSVPLSVLWPDEFLARSEELIEFRIGANSATLIDTSIEIVDPQLGGPIRFRVFSDAAAAEYEVAFANGTVEYRPLGVNAVEVVVGRQSRTLSEVLSENPPDINFSDGSFLVGDALFQFRADYRPPYQRDEIESVDWTGVDITTESQGLVKRPDSIQRRVIELLTAVGVQPPFDVVFDDDGAGESADVVALRLEAERLVVQLLHCKFSGGAQPGPRVGDLYTVCGQAQRSVSWRGEVDRLLEHLERRDAKRRKAGQTSRFEQGDRAALRNIRRRLDQLSPVVEVVIVQPGLSRANASNDQLELLAVTQFYLQTTFGVPLRVIGSD